MAHTCRALRHVWASTVLHWQVLSPNSNAHQGSLSPTLAEKRGKYGPPELEGRDRTGASEPVFAYANALLLLIAAQHIIERHNALEGSLACSILNR